MKKEVADPEFVCVWGGGGGGGRGVGGGGVWIPPEI